MTLPIHRYRRICIEWHSTFHRNRRTCIEWHPRFLRYRMTCFEWHSEFHRNRSTCIEWHPTFYTAQVTLRRPELDCCIVKWNNWIYWIIFFFTRKLFCDWGNFNSQQLAQDNASVGFFLSKLVPSWPHGTCFAKHEMQRYGTVTFTYYLIPGIKSSPESTINGSLSTQGEKMHRNDSTQAFHNRGSKLGIYESTATWRSQQWISHLNLPPYSNHLVVRATKSKWTRGFTTIHGLHGHQLICGQNLTNGPRRLKYHSL